MEISPDLLFDLVEEFKLNYGDVSCCWEINKQQLHSMISKYFYYSQWPALTDFDSITIFGIPVSITNTQEIKLVECAGLPIKKKVGNLISVLCVNCAAPLNTMKCDYCGTVHRQSNR